MILNGGGYEILSTAAQDRSVTCLSWVRLLFSRIYTTFLRFTHIIFCGHLRLGWIPTWRYEDRVLPVVALWACFWLHLWHRHVLSSFQACIPFNLPVLGLSSLLPASKLWINSAHWFSLYLHSVATTVVLLNHPLCIRLFGTDFVKHFYGIVRQIQIFICRCYNTTWCSNAPSFSRSSENVNLLLVIVYPTVVATRSYHIMTSTISWRVSASMPPTSRHQSFIHFMRHCHSPQRNPTLTTN